MGSLSVTYRAADHHAVTASADRSFFESNIEGSPGVYTTNYFVGLMFAPNPTSYLKIGPVSLATMSLITSARLSVKR